MTAILGVAFFAMLAVGVPIAFALGLAAVAVYLIQDPGQLAIVPARLYAGIDLFALLAIPFYILSGELMNSSGILARLLDLARLLVGRFRGALLQINITTSMIFGGINGSAIAEASAVGSMLIPAITKEYKAPALAGAVTACASVVGPIIPPSIPMIIYALIAGNVSVAALFAAGIVPGFLIGAGFMVIAYVIARRRNLSALNETYTWPEVFAIWRRSLLPLMLPVILVGGVLSGIFTAVESGVVAVVYALIVGLLVTRELTFRACADACARTGSITSVVLLLMGMANVVTWIVTMEQVPHAAVQAIKAVATEPWVFLLLVNIVLLAVGLFIDLVAAMIMFVPILIPVAASFGVDPLHLGMIVVLNLVIGLVTPPVGICLFVAASMSKVGVIDVVREAYPFVLWLIVVLFFVTYVPEVYLWVPRLMGY